jgi:hypothetical protein
MGDMMKSLPENKRKKAVVELDRKFIGIFSMDVAAVTNRVERDVVEIEMAIAEFQFQGYLLSLFVHLRQVEKVSDETPVEVSAGTIADHIVRSRLAHPEMKQKRVDKLIECFNHVADLVEENFIKKMF